MKALTNNFKSSMVDQFVESFSEPANTIYYMVAHRSIPFVDEQNPPSIDISTRGKYDLFDEVLFGKHITPNDVSYMIDNHTWTTGTVYDTYDDIDDTLSSKTFFVVSQESGSYHVFKCLNNNNGSPSTSQPLYSQTAPNDEVYITADGYQWKYMFTIPSNIWDKFATTKYAPVVINANVTANAVSGTVDTIKVTSGGSRYNSFANGTIKEARVAGNNLIYSLTSDTSTLSANTDYYKNCSIYIRSGSGAGQLKTITEYIVSGTEKRVLIDSAFATDVDITSVFEITPRVIITGDGSGAEAIATVNTASSNSISNIEVINLGSGYTYAEATIVANTGLIDANGNAISANSATSRPIISPNGGHGSDVINELFSNKVAMSVTFNGTEFDTIPATNDFRKVSILKEPRFANTELTISGSATSFTAGELITQANTGATGYVSNRSGSIVRVENIRGFFQSGYNITGSTSAYTSNVTSVDRTFETFDQRQIYQGTILYNGTDGLGFTEDQHITQASTQSDGYVFDITGTANASIISLTGVKGTISVSDTQTSTINTIIGDGNGAEIELTGRDYSKNYLMDNSGDFIYVEDFTAVSRNSAQSEKIKVIIEF